MANLFIPARPTTATFSGEMVWLATDTAVVDTNKKYIQSIGIEHNPVYNIKYSGFESTKRQVGNNSGTNAVIRISLDFVSWMPRSFLSLMIQLAKAVNGGGMYLTYRDDLCTDKIYTCRWVNAGDWVETHEGHSSLAMDLLSYSFTDVA